MERKDEHGKHYSPGKEDRCSCGKILRHKSKIAAGVFFLAGVFSCWTVMAFKTQQSCPPPRPDSCADGWIGYKGKCYYFTEAEGNWTYSQSRCSALGASLAGIDTKQDLDFMLRYKGTTDPWIGLQRGTDREWKWVNGTKFNLLFEVRGDADCAYLKETAVSASRCYIMRSWICNKPYASSTEGRFTQTHQGDARA